MSAQAKAIDGGNTPEQEQANSDYDFKSSTVNLVNSLLVLGAFYGFFVYFEPLKQTDFGNSQGDKMKFEIKKANEMEQRLADVKGIGEISTEIEELIRMIKNSHEFTSKGAKLHKGVLLSQLLSGSPGTSSWYW